MTEQGTKNHQTANMGELRVGVGLFHVCCEMLDKSCAKLKVATGRCLVDDRGARQASLHNYPSVSESGLDWLLAGSSAQACGAKMCSLKMSAQAAELH